MGATPAKYFPFPQPYGSSPEMGVLSQAKAAPQAPPTNFLPLNQPDTQPMQPPVGPTQPQSMFGNPALRNLYRYGGSGGMFNRSQLYD